MALLPWHLDPEVPDKSEETSPPRPVGEPLERRKGCSSGGIGFSSMPLDSVRIVMNYGFYMVFLRYQYHMLYH